MEDWLALSLNSFLPRFLVVRVDLLKGQPDLLLDFIHDLSKNERLFVRKVRTFRKTVVDAALHFLHFVDHSFTMFKLQSVANFWQRVLLGLSVYLYLVRTPKRLT